MFGFLLQLWHLITGDIKAITKWITTALTAVYSFIDRSLHVIWASVIQLQHYAQDLAKAAWTYIYSVYVFAKWIVDVVIPHLARWALAELNDLLHFAMQVLGYAVRAFDFLVHLIASVESTIVQWALKEIWDPLFNAVTGAIRWIGKEGAFVYYLLTHPDKLAALLAKYIWSAWGGLFRMSAGPIAKWLLHEMRKETGLLAEIIEDIVAAMLH